MYIVWTLNFQIHQKYFIDLNRKSNILLSIGKKTSPKALFLICNSRSKKWRLNLVADVITKFVELSVVSRAKKLGAKSGDENQNTPAAAAQTQLLIIHLSCSCSCWRFPLEFITDRPTKRPTIAQQQLN